MNLAKGDQIVTAYAESASGPGWGNTPIWVIVRSAAGDLRQECIQPAEQSRDMRTLYAVSMAAADAMRRAVETTITRE